MAHKAEIIVFLDVAGTARTSIDLIDLCDGDPACPGQPILPYCLKTDWREQIAASIIEDILYDHRALPALKLLLLTHARFKLFRRRDNGVDDNCNRQSTFKLKMQDTIDTGSSFCVAVRLYEHDMLANQLSFRGVMPVATLPSTLFPLAGKTASPVIPGSAPVPALVTPPGPLLIVECATQRSLRPPTMPPPTSAVTSAPIPAPVTPPGPLLIVECATQRSLSSPGPASDKGEPHDSPLPVDRAYGLQVAPPYLKVPTGPPVLHHQHAPVLAGPAPDPWPRDVPMDVDRNTQRRRPSHFVDALVPSGDDPPSISPPDVDCCPALPAPDLHCRPRGCDEDASAPRAHPTCSTTPTPIPPAAPPHNNGAPATLGDPPPVATSLLLIVAAATHTSTPPCCTTTQHRCAS
jgi:hypothetical protein